MKYFFLIRCCETGRKPGKWFKRHAWRIKKAEVAKHRHSQTLSNILGRGKRVNLSQRAVVWNSLLKQSTAQVVNMKRPTKRATSTNTAHIHLKTLKNSEKMLKSRLDFTRTSNAVLRSASCNVRKRQERQGDLLRDLRAWLNKTTFSTKLKLHHQIEFISHTNFHSTVRLFAY